MPSRARCREGSPYSGRSTVTRWDGNRDVECRSNPEEAATRRVRQAVSRKTDLVVQMGLGFDPSIAILDGSMGERYSDIECTIVTSASLSSALGNRGIW